MKRRYLYAMMFSVPALVFSAITTAALTAAIAGVLWTFVLGDNAWPSFVHRSMSALISAVFGCLWVALLSAAYVWGKRQEASAAINKSHVFLAVGSSAGLLLLALLHLLNAGTIGPKPDSIVCSDFCATKSFSGSMSPHDGSCRCLGAGGREDLVLSMASVRAASD